MRNFMTYMMVAHNFVHIILNSFLILSLMRIHIISIYDNPDKYYVFISRNKVVTIIDICERRNYWHLSAFEMAP